MLIFLFFLKLFLGSPFLGKIHFSTAFSSNAEYAGLKACLPIIERAAMAYSRQYLQLSKHVCILSISLPQL